MSSFYFNDKGLILNASGRVIGKLHAPGLDFNDISEILPASSYNVTIDIDVAKNAAELEKQVRYLQSVEQPVQRSKPWFDLRHKSLTASDLAGAIGESKYEKPFDILEKKCGYGKEFTGNAITQWGVKYETVAMQIYSRRKNVKVIDFGLLPHPRIPFLAASPDGITPQGTMLEIKCPPKREITGIVPHNYWIQMQLQMEVCELEVCDFEECRIEEYRGFKDFSWDICKDASAMRTAQGLEKGVLIELFDNEEMDYAYRFCPLDYDLNRLSRWVQETERMYRSFPANVFFRYEKTSYWKLTKYSCVAVPRDRQWFDKMFPRMKSFWREVCYYRTQPKEVLYADHNKKPRFVESFEDEEQPPAPSALKFLSDSDDDRESKDMSASFRTLIIDEASPKPKPELKVFLSDSD